MKRFWFIFVALALVPGMALAQSVDESTTDAGVVVIDQVHYFIVPTGDAVHITEYYLIGNTGDLTYIGTETAAGTRATLTFTLPPGAYDLTFEGPGLGERYAGVRADAGDVTRFADTSPVPPGTATVDVDFRYRLPFTEGMRIERTMDAPVTMVALIVNSADLGLAGPGLIPQGMMDTQMGPAAIYSAGPLAAGETLAFTLVPQTMTPGFAPGRGATATSRAADPVRDVGLGVAVLAVAILVGYRLWQPASVSPPVAALPLLEAIAALDARFTDGDLQEEAYHQERETLKQQLLARLQQQ